MAAKEELKEYILKLTDEQIIAALPRLISELEAQGLPVHRLIHLQTEMPSLSLYRPDFTRCIRRGIHRGDFASFRSRCT